jgi:hypothetical protein
VSTPRPGWLPGCGTAGEQLAVGPGEGARVFGRRDEDAAAPARGAPGHRPRCPRPRTPSPRAGPALCGTRLLPGGHDIHAGPGGIAGRRVGPSGHAHHASSPPARVSASRSRSADSCAPPGCSVPRMCMILIQSPVPASQPALRTAQPAPASWRNESRARPAAPGSRANPYSGTGGPWSSPARRPP